MEGSKLQSAEESLDLSERELMTASGQKIENDTNSSNKTPLWAIYLTMAVTMMGIAIGVSSTWPYLQKIDEEVHPEFLGWINFGFNLAAIFGDIIYGRWIHFRPNREPLLGSMFVLIISGIVFATAQGIGGTSGLWVVLISRFWLGLARGNMTITRAIISEATTTKKRSHAMANLTIAMTSGFAAGSGIQALVALMGEEGLYFSALRLHFNLYTIPAYLIVILGTLNGILIFHSVKPISQVVELNVGPDKEEEPFKGKIMACASLISMFAVVNFCLSLMETLMIPFIQHQFSLTRAKAVWYGGLVFLFQGLAGIFQQGVVRLLLKRFTDRFLIVLFYTCLALSFFLYVSLGSTELRIKDAVMSNSSLNASDQERSSVGCPAKFSWCRDSPRIWLPQFLLGALLFSVGFSSCLGLLVSLYTKIIAVKRQGRLVSIISASGNIGRLTAPIVGSASYVAVGPRYTFASVCLLLIVFLSTFLFKFDKMVPATHIELPVLVDGENGEKEESWPENDLFLVTPV